MSYRDDLEAAHARIAALESQLAAAGGGDTLLPLFDRLAHVEKLFASVGQQTAEVARATAKSTELEALAAALRSRVESVQQSHIETMAELRSTSTTSLPTLAEFNRAKPTITGATGARVVCNICLLMCGERVEMTVGSKLGFNVSSNDADTVSCPRCGASGMKRK